MLTQVLDTKQNTVYRHQIKTMTMTELEQKHVGI